MPDLSVTIMFLCTAQFDGLVQALLVMCFLTLLHLLGMIMWTFCFLSARGANVTGYLVIMTSKIAAALIDLSGTLHIEDVAIPGAIDALRR